MLQLSSLSSRCEGRRGYFVWRKKEAPFRKIGEPRVRYMTALRGLQGSFASGPGSPKVSDLQLRKFPCLRFVCTWENTPTYETIPIICHRKACYDERKKKGTRNLLSSPPPPVLGMSTNTQHPCTPAMLIRLGACLQGVFGLPLTIRCPH